MTDGQSEAGRWNRPDHVINDDLYLCPICGEPYPDANRCTVGDEKDACMTCYTEHIEKMWFMMLAAD